MLHSSDSSAAQVLDRNGFYIHEDLEGGNGVVATFPSPLTSAHTGQVTRVSASAGPQRPFSRPLGVKRPSGQG